MKILIVTKKTVQVCNVCRAGWSQCVKVACTDKEYFLDNAASEMCLNLVQLVQFSNFALFSFWKINK